MESSRSFPALLHGPCVLGQEEPPGVRSAALIFQSRASFNGPNTAMRSRYQSSAVLPTTTFGMLGTIPAIAQRRRRVQRRCIPVEQQIHVMELWIDCRADGAQRPADLPSECDRLLLKGGSSEPLSCDLTW